MSDRNTFDVVIVFPRMTEVPANGNTGFWVEFLTKRESIGMGGCSSYVCLYLIWVQWHRWVLIWIF